ncbi:MAG TPA: PPOX class F420-dependent oxidoreductase [Nitrososphaeraceae archaeon]
MNNNDNSLETGKYICILTYKKNGDGVSTPVWFIRKDNKIYIRTSNQSGKVKRIKNNNNVSYALCNISGRIKGEWHSGVAKIEPDVNKMIFSKITEKYGLIAQIINILYKIKKMEIIIISIESRD